GPSVRCRRPGVPVWRDNGHAGPGYLPPELPSASRCRLCIHGAIRCKVGAVPAACAETSGRNKEPEEVTAVPLASPLCCVWAAITAFAVGGNASRARWRTVHRSRTVVAHEMRSYGDWQRSRASRREQAPLALRHASCDTVTPHSAKLVHVQHPTGIVGSPNRLAQRRPRRTGAVADL